MMHADTSPCIIRWLDRLYKALRRLSLVSAAAIGFNVETVSYKNIKFQVWDLGGQTSIRPYWRCYYPNTQVGALRQPMSSLATPVP